MFRPPIVDIFREILFEGLLHKRLKQFTNILNQENAF